MISRETDNILFSRQAFAFYLLPAAAIYAGKEYLKSTREAAIIALAMNVLTQLGTLLVKKSDYEERAWVKFTVIFPLLGACAVAKILQLSLPNFLYCLGLSYVSTSIYRSIEETFKWHQVRTDY